MLSSGVIDSQDGFQYLGVARNIYYNGKPTSPPDESKTRQNVHMTVINKNGESYSTTGLGFSLALVPAVALTDIVYKIYHVSPPVHFPLENDWLILLLASFTNAFFGALLGVTLFLYLIELGSSKKQALFISLAGLFTTNLLAYTKHSFAHIMFTTLVLLSFYFLKRFSRNLNSKALLLSGFCLGLASITYNITFLLVVPSLVFYYLSLRKINLKNLPSKKIAFDLLIFLVGLLPGLFTYFWFEHLRTLVNNTFGAASPMFLGNYAKTRLITVPISIFYEGVYEQILSPGRGLFLYSPILLLIAIFWYKIRRSIKPELIVFLSLSIVYIVFYSTQYGSFGRSAAGFWHGESSWGPRYLTPLIPFGMLIVSNIYQQLKKFQKVLIVLPLLLIGFYIEILGTLMPYQIKYHDLERSVELNGVDYTMYYYTNLLPRYSSVLMMSKKLVKLVKSFPLSWNHGAYNVRFYDGIDFPFNVGPERWRVIENTGYIYFDNRQAHPAKTLSFGLINHIIGESSASATLNFYLNNKPLPDQLTIFQPREKKIINLSIPGSYLVNTDNLLEIKVQYSDSLVEKEKSQILGMISMSVNDSNVNLESIDTPYVSNLGPAMGVSYRNWGGTNKDPWKYWDIHTQTFERLPDFWWIRNLYYWDIPKRWILGSLFVIITGLSITVFKLYPLIKRLK